LLAAAIIGAFTAFAPYLAAAEGFYPRNIFEFTALSYSTGSGWMRVENAVLFPVSQSLTPGIHVAFTNSADERRYRVQPGLVWVIGEGFYSELIYGLSANEVGTWMQEWSAEVTHESARTLESARIRGSYNHASGNLSLSPDAAFRYNFTPRYAAKLQYFFGYESAPTWVHSLKLENTFQSTGDFSGTLILIGTKKFLRERRTDAMISGGANAGADSEPAHAEIRRHLSLAFLGLRPRELADARLVILAALASRAKSVSPGFARLRKCVPMPRFFRARGGTRKRPRD
jgi:hypothetical protein